LRDRALVQVLYTSGMRISEALSLKRSSIDWETREALIIGKGNKQRRVYFSEKAISWLQTYLMYRYDRDQALFVTGGDTPRPIRAEGTWRRFRRYAKLAGLGRHVYPHMFRHTMATTLLANGCPIGHIRALLGHEHLATTCRYYLGIISDKEAKRAHEQFLAQSEPGTPDDETRKQRTNREAA
jgi:integrase/recombinase XerD